MWVPPRVSAEQASERAAYQAELAEQAARIHSRLDHFNKALKRLDEYLELVWALENATALGLVPGRFHVLRHNPGAPPDLFPVQTPDGGFKEPDSTLFDDLAKSDLWSNRSLKAKQKRELEAQRAKERAREREQQERLDELAERWGAANRVQVQI